jgi:hypothetical protein
MLGSKALWPLGVIFFVVGLTLEAGATGAIKAVRMSAKLVSGHNPAGQRSATRFPGLSTILFNFIRAMKTALGRDAMVPAVNGDPMSQAMRFQGILRRLAIVDEGFVGDQAGLVFGLPGVAGAFGSDIEAAPEDPDGT